ncbi:MAG: hypothetical protein WBC44_18035 [Planctomycetaceae bacterium]
MSRQPSSPDDSRPGWRDPVVVAAACAAVTQLVIVWVPAFPLGVPGEWTWQRITYGSGQLASVFLDLFIAIPAALAYLWYCRAGERRLAVSSHGRRRLWLAGLAASGFAWLWVVQESAPNEIHRLGRAPVVHYFPSFSGYFTEARNADDFGSYLATYDTLMAKGDVLHIGTHPPGLTTVHWGLLRLYESSPALTGLTLATRPHSVRETEVMLSMTPQTEGESSTRAELAELWAVSLLAQFAAAAAVVPLFHLGERSAGPVAAWRAATFWPLIPALAVFLPKSDAVFPLFGLGVLALWCRPGPPSVMRAAFAGLVFWLGMTFSLAMLPVAALTGLLSAQAVINSDRSDRRHVVVRTIASASVAVIVFLSMTAAVWLFFELNLIKIWSWNYHNHAGFYDVYDRTYWKWLIVGPCELAIAIGAPAAVAAITAVRRCSWSTPAFAALCVIALLWLSGKNAGESARLWLFLMPWLLWMTVSLWKEDAGQHRWRIVLPLQLVVSFLTVIRIDGFGFDEFLRMG